MKNKKLDVFNVSESESEHHCTHTGLWRSSSFEFQVAKFESWAKHDLKLHLRASVGNASARHSRRHPGTIISPFTGVENRDYATANKPDPRTVY